MTAKPRVRLIQLSVETLRALADGDLRAAERAVGIALPKEFISSQWRATWRRRREQVESDPLIAGLVTGVIRDDNQRLAVGRVGYHGPLYGDGIVELGYYLVP